MTLGEKIQELRRRYGMSQDALAERLEVSRQAVSKWERDEAVPETDKIIRISQVFGVSTDYLLRPDEPAPEPPHAPWGPRPRSLERTIERLVRRHGYKVGYLFIAGGALLCIIALLVMALMPRFGSGMFEAAGNMVVIKTLSGMANAVAVCVDSLNHNDIVGSVAGDDTILLVVKTVDIALNVERRLKNAFGV